MLADLLYRLRALFRRGSMEDELDAELRQHFEHEVDRWRARGFSEDDARVAARRELGDLERAKEVCRDARGVMWWETLRQDLRYALRQMRRRPGLTASVVLALALGTGLNLALFRVVWGVLLKPLPYPQPEQLVELWNVDQGGWAESLPDRESLERWRSRATTLSGVAAYRAWMITVTGPVAPERVRAAVVSNTFFSLLGVTPGQGRLFANADDKVGMPDVVVVSHAFWLKHFGARKLAAGDTLEADGRLCRIIGVLPADYHGTILMARHDPELYLPYQWLWEGGQKFQSCYVIGRLRNGATVEQARAELNTLSREGEAPRQQRSGAIVKALGVDASRQMKRALQTLFSLTACVLLIACFSVANLLLAQALARRQEFAIRAALGAGRQRLMRQLGVEALLLSLFGTAAGAATGWVLLRLFVAITPQPLPRAQESGSGLVLPLFAIVLATLTALASGLLPAWLATSSQRSEDLRTSHASMGQRNGRWMRALVAAQLAFTVVVLVSAALLLKSFVALRSVDPGFVRENVLTTQIILPDTGYPAAEDRERFVRRWTERVSALPGVESAGTTCSLPLRYNFELSTRIVVPSSSAERTVPARIVAGDYFQAMGLRMRAGRPLKAADAWRLNVLAVNEAFVRRYLPGGAAVGTNISFGPHIKTIVGVVSDIHATAIAKPAEPEIYVPFGVLPYPYIDVAVRSRLPVGQLTAMLRHELRSLDPKLALGITQTLEDVVDEDLAQPRLQAVLVALFALVALALATLGVYGVVAQSVRARTAELGVRMALGATPGQVARSVLRQGLAAPLAGLAIGLAAAWAASHYLASLLYGVTPHDVDVFGTAALVLAAASFVSCALPARIAARVDPARVLREE